MELLVDAREKRAVASLYDDRAPRLPVLEADSEEPITVGVVERIRLPFGARLFAPQSLSGYTLRAVVGIPATGEDTTYTVATLSTEAASAGISVALVQQGGAGVNHQVRITLSGDIYKGTCLFSALGAQSGPIGYDVSAAQFRRAVEAVAGVGEGNVEVSQEDAGVYLVTFIADLAATAITGISVDGSNLVAIQKRSGTLNLHADAITALLDEDESRVVSLEIERIRGSNPPEKIMRRDIILRRAVAPPDSETDETLAQIIASYSGSSPAITVNADSTHTRAPDTPFSQWSQKIIAQAGSGAYDADFTLDEGNPVEGAMYYVSIEFAASANPTVNIYDQDAAVIESVTNTTPGVAAYYLFEARFKSGAWEKLSGQWIL